MKTKIWCSSALACLIMASCGVKDKDVEQKRNPNEGDAIGTVLNKVIPDGFASEDKDYVLETLELKIGTNESGLFLANSEVINQEGRAIQACVIGTKYLSVEGDLSLPSNVYGQKYETGCLDITVFDNINYPVNTSLRVSTSGVSGVFFPLTKIPMSIKNGEEWQSLPLAPDAFPIADLAADSVKSFSTSICLQLDFTEKPFQPYAGSIFIQYLKPANTPDYKALAESYCGEGVVDETIGANPLPIMACDSGSMTIEQGQSVRLQWDSPMKPVLQHLSGDVSQGHGRLSTLDEKSVTYTAPSSLQGSMTVSLREASVDNGVSCELTISTGN